MRAALFDVFGTLLDVYSVTRRAEEHVPGPWRAACDAVARQADRILARADDVRALRTVFAGDARGTRVRGAGPEACRPMRRSSPRCRTNTSVSLRSSMWRRRSSDCSAPACRRACCPMATPRCSRRRSSPRACIATSISFYPPTRCSAFKTSPQVYALGPRALKRPADEILFVSSNGWDAVGRGLVRLHKLLGQPDSACRSNNWEYAPTSGRP